MWWIFTVVAISFSIPTLPLELQGKHVWVYLSLLFIRALKRTAGPLPYCCNYNNSSLFVGDGLTFLKSINTYSLDGTPLPKSINSYSVSKNSYSLSSTGKKKGQISVALTQKKICWPPFRIPTFQNVPRCARRSSCQCVAQTAQPTTTSASWKMWVVSFFNFQTTSTSMGSISKAL